jgi:septin family protein
MYKAGTSCTLLCLLGPNGVGMTTAMVQLMKDRNHDHDMFIDLGALSPTEVITLDSNCSTLFIDNAQLYNRATLAPSMLRRTFVVAAFSPGARFRATLN